MNRECLSTSFDYLCFLSLSADPVVRDYFTFLAIYKWYDFNLVSKYSLLLCRNVVFLYVAPRFCDIEELTCNSRGL